MSTFLGMPRGGDDVVPGPPADTGVGRLTGSRPFPAAAREALGNSRLRRNLSHATSTIRAKRAQVVQEVPDWEELRDAGSAVKAATLARLPELLEELEANVTARGGVVHWARDAAEANAVVTSVVLATGADEVVKVKSMATQEIGLNEALEAAGVTALETDLAELIVQLADDRPSHILVPAIHRGRAEIRQIFAERMPGVDASTLTDDPAVLAAAARAHLREAFLRARVAVSGANFAVAQTGTLAVVESEGNGRMCLTLPQTLITVMGIEKVVPTWSDLEVFLQLLPRSSTGERMNPYTSTWSGVTPGDGPQEFHLVLLDNGRSRVLADESGRAALHCIRCSACLNVCPVYERAGGHAYGSVYPGPIGAVLTPQLTGLTGEDDPNDSLPYASSLCGACYDVCPVKINIPELLVQLRAEHTQTHAERHRLPTAEAAAMRAAAWVMGDARRFARAGRAAGAGRHGIRKGRPVVPLPPPLSGWTSSRDVPQPPSETFRDWWARTRGGQS
ncbi:LutB/LldF family L-lactate oxidation iron-sulfur protein [Knoellia sp. p5-6-4]|uniref:LutB/LldF family L-lactate oxidation iron-sulfur protein n=1 Tax=unclassified Knoellia TaxID=2618719 RepID=UPI0023DB2DD0|nr:LutB/LldF family L-lactate oxidation iron-sulfur protein [Knoellia sp. p5-6-4]MDF2143432.1 LutB/LldF family L-lactate oxidation iron-sulfur protein [Knoellia sp. p5-6-4]